MFCGLAGFSSRNPFPRGGDTFSSRSEVKRSWELVSREAIVSTEHTNQHNYEWSMSSCPSKRTSERSSESSTAWRSHQTSSKIISELGWKKNPSEEGIAADGVYMIQSTLRWDSDFTLVWKAADGVYMIQSTLRRDSDFTLVWKAFDSLQQSELHNRGRYSKNKHKAASQ